MFRNLLFFGLIALASCAPWAPWQMYVDDQLIGQGLVKAAIIDHDGKVLAISKGFSVRKIISLIRVLLRLLLDS